MSDHQPNNDLGMHRLITRRDFLNGAATAAGTAAWLLAMEEPAKGAQQDAPGYYPTARKPSSRPHIAHGEIR
jgi:hypothetical protein